VTLRLSRGYSLRFERMCRLQLQGLEVDSAWTWDLESLEAIFFFETSGNHPGMQCFLPEVWNPRLDRRETRNVFLRPLNNSGMGASTSMCPFRTTGSSVSKGTDTDRNWTLGGAILTTKFRPLLVPTSRRFSRYGYCGLGIFVKRMAGR
jgi:hypothetical protein